MTAPKNSKPPIKKIPIKNKISLKPYVILADAVAMGVESGLRRSMKHVNSEESEIVMKHFDTISSQIYINVMDALTEVIDFENVK